MRVPFEVDSFSCQFNEAALEMQVFSFTYDFRQLCRKLAPVAALELYHVRPTALVTRLSAYSSEYIMSSNYRSEETKTTSYMKVVLRLLAWNCGEKANITLPTLSHVHTSNFSGSLSAVGRSNNDLRRRQKFVVCELGQPSQTFSCVTIPNA